MLWNPERIALPVLLLIGAGVFFTGLNWGLPSRSADPYLFGSHRPWTGREIIDLAGGWENDPGVGADVAHNPLFDRDRVVVVNDTDAKRAAIVRRYRLFSYQPDEMITLRALSSMNPGRLQLDPKLYQYGGLWIYPVGALLQISAKLHLIDLHGDVAYYLDHPDAFGRFYVVARFYTALWALAGVVTVYLLVRRIIGGWIFPSTAALCFIFMPVVVNMAHEAKPHLPGAVLALLVVLAAARYVERGRTRDWVIAGTLWGAAFGMVLTMLPVFGVLPVMVLLRRSSIERKFKHASGAIAVGVLVYVFTNPYVVINLIWNRAVLRSNLGNSSAMYHAQVSSDGIANAAKLIAFGTSPVLAAAGVVGAIALGIRALRRRRSTDPTEVRRRATGVLLAIPALCIAGQFVLAATGKPAEFGRFALLTDVALAIEAVAAVATSVSSNALRGALLGALLATTAIPGVVYLRAFARDGRQPTGRIVVARQLREWNELGAHRLAVYAEPAPYCLPPVDLFRWQILLLPRNAPPEAGMRVGDVSIQAVDVPVSAREGGRRRAMLAGKPISWADKPFDVRLPIDGASGG